MSKKCANCEADNLDIAKFCSDCGTVIDLGNTMPISTKSVLFSDTTRSVSHRRKRVVRDKTELKDISENHVNDHKNSKYRGKVLLIIAILAVFCFVLSLFLHVIIEDGVIVDLFWKKYPSLYMTIVDINDLTAEMVRISRNDIQDYYDKNTVSIFENLHSGKISLLKIDFYAWVYSVSNFDFSRNISYYYENVTYFGAQRTIEEIREDKKRFFDVYDIAINNSCSNLTFIWLSIDTVITRFDLEFKYMSSTTNRIYEASVKKEVKWMRAGRWGGWKIIGEHDLEVYSK